MQPDLFRTEVCFQYARHGVCSYGASCTFAHTAEQLRPASRSTPPSPPQARACASATAKAEELHDVVEALQSQVDCLRAKLCDLESQRAPEGARPSPARRATEWRSAPALRACDLGTCPGFAASVPLGGLAGLGGGGGSVEAQAGGFSRMTTYEPPSGASWSVSSAASLEGEPCVDDLLGEGWAPPQTEAGEADGDEVVEAMWVVRHTFLSLVPRRGATEATARRRARSAPVGSVV